MLTKKYEEIIESSKGSDEKIIDYKNLEKQALEFFTKYNANSYSQLKYNIKDSEILNCELKHKYSNIDISNNNKILFKYIINNLLSPINSLNKYSSFFEKKEKDREKSERQRESDFLSFIINDSLKEENVVFINEDKIRYEEDEIVNNDEEKKENVFYANNVYQPTYKIISKLQKEISQIEEVEIIINNNQEEESRNYSIKTVFELGGGLRDKKRESDLEPTKKNLIKNIYLATKQDFILNINIKVILKKDLDFQKIMVIKDIFNQNGIFLRSKENKVPMTITIFDLIMLFNGLKVKK